ncbi:MAG TPA: DUF1844 domain-containing protein, partial [Candidatus Polarisedimenticolia bacterium]|nr:DUF1844 domain-containing protein [Candidatus Polarisedimenticolia bacterium]
MAEREGKKEPIKVTDRRAFTAEGQRRSPEAASPEPEKTERLQGEGFELRRERPGPSQGAGPPSAVDFNSFILSLTSTAFIHLGEMEDPVTGQVGVQLDAARQMIDIIDMLHAKTKGNLEPKEEEFLSGILFELKMR